METYLDVDGCLLDTSYNETAALIVPERAHITLNSNRSLELLLKIQRRFGIDGPIIFENGSGRFDGRIGSFAPLLDRSVIEKMVGNISWVDTDTLRRPEPINRYTVFGERTRRFTSTLYPRSTTRAGFTAEMLEELSGQLQHLESYKTVIDPVFGNVSITPIGVDKATPMCEGNAAFGDARQDIPMIAHATLVGCPQNAEQAVLDEVTRRGGFVGLSYTQGVNGFLSEVYR
jgi:hydroxymethylpyrimidine pyrophosphatase-like HAD family hydrolase